MLKKTFLKKLETNLTPLGEEKVFKIIKKYENIIDKEISNGKSEKDVVASLGDIDMIAKIYLDTEEKEANEEKKEEANKSSLDELLNKFTNFIDNTFKNLDGDTSKKILIILFFVAIGVLAISLLKIPFKILGYTGESIFNHIFVDGRLLTAVSVIWAVCLTLCCMGLVIFFLVKYTKAISSKYKDDIGPEISSKVSTTADSVFDVLIIILKVFAVIVTIPIITAVAGLTITLLLLIALIINGVSIFGPAIVVLGLIILFSSLLDIIYSSLFKGGRK